MLLIRRRLPAALPVLVQLSTGCLPGGARSEAMCFPLVAWTAQGRCVNAAVQAGLVYCERSVVFNACYLHRPCT